MSDTKPTNKPVNKIKSGAITASIFAHSYTRKDGTGQFTSYSVEITRAFTRDDGQTFEHTSSIDAQNIDNAMLALKAAGEWIQLQQSKAAA